ncbi:DUF2332 family protein [Macrococcus equipercicus]|uniref:DUF2332 family protein n=1 Tax=Macrococcus equipercicus TaxID=69967 RepID=A0A9Q9BQE1_9STAP|nr:DUF2332 family protein [Macrococcus equipercicus]UTH14790.1 DUF2332 family protein [Macrococcus equipercicus]
MSFKYRNLMLSYSSVIDRKSPLYSDISKRMADDKELKMLLSPLMTGPEAVPLFMSSVLYSLYYHDDELRDYYMNFNDFVKPFDDDAYGLFKSFVQRHRDMIIMMTTTGDLKKNIVERSSLLVPVFHRIVKEVSSCRFNVIEVGSKAGLLLNYDWYGYTFNKAVSVGDTEHINIKVKLKGYNHSLLKPLEHPHMKYGISESVTHIENDDEFYWMLSLLYPEETKRRKNLLKARQIFLEHPVTMLEGDELVLLEQVIDELPADEPIIIFHVHHTKNWSDEKKANFLSLISRKAADKEIYHVHHQLFGSDIFLDYFNEGYLKREKLANFDLDKLKIEWLVNQPLKI